MPFTDEHYAMLIEWIDSERLNYQWGGFQFTFPLTHRQLNKYFSNRLSRPFLCQRDGVFVGFVELYQASKNVQRICRVFIQPDYRGKGLASEMLRLVIAVAKADHPMSAVTLSVFSHNHSAIQCYQQLGFEQTEVVKNVRFIEGRYWDLWLMSLTENKIME
ncbi:GNAT family N-acetyltransferase [Vibrio sp. ZSDZ65]|uniref:GNAT family N-acetyltransferase n=1 Tax=Vibrio qingdaonensis TaxID=2829491 RepID=A0A9X3CJM6_9VIBR|nr:GNAT family protein [Vibrio qingdaonensis]MCW8344673.1 GNAT family N-acetyltransferase [Vibrio qingdaonensis]